MIWSKTPPTKSGWYWVKSHPVGFVYAARFDPDDEPGYQWLCPFKPRWVRHETMCRDYLFGPPVPSPEQCHEIAKGGGA